MLPAQQCRHEHCRGKGKLRRKRSTAARSLILPFNRQQGKETKYGYSEIHNEDKVVVAMRIRL